MEFKFFRELQKVKSSVSTPWISHNFITFHEIRQFMIIKSDEIFQNSIKLTQLYLEENDEMNVLLYCVLSLILK